MLSVSPFKTVRRKHDVGQVASWKVQGKPTGAILQYVEHRTYVKGQGQEIHKFTEAWRVLNGRVLPVKQDFFLIPRAYHDTEGRVNIRAQAWFVPGKFADVMHAAGIDDSDSEVSGVLASKVGKVPKSLIPPTKHMLSRRWRAKWYRSSSKANFNPFYSK